MNDHTIKTLRRIEAEAGGADREGLHLISGLLSGLLGAHRHEIAAFGPDGEWDAAFDAAHASATDAVAAARDRMRDAALAEIGTAAPGRTFEPATSVGDARRQTIAALDHGGETIDGPTRATFNGWQVDGGRIEWADGSRTTLLLAGDHVPPIRIDMDDVIAASSMGGLSIVARSAKGPCLIEVKRLSEAA